MTRTRLEKNRLHLNIFSKNVEVTVSGKCLAIKKLLEELKLYGQLNADVIDMYINIAQDKITDSIASNPSTHIETQKGFGYIIQHPYGKSETVFELEENNKKLFFNYNGKDKWYLYKFLSIQYCHPYEEIGTKFHEDALVPAFVVFFPEEISFLHGSCVCKDDEAIIITGTGGVGKTTLELHLILNCNYYFLADDMVPICGNNVYQNLSFPKIYKYNVYGWKELKKKIAELNRSPLAKLNWYIKPYIPILGGGQVRRRVNPLNFFSGKVAKKANSKYVIFINRTKKVKDITLDQNVDPTLLAKASLYVIKNEMRTLFEHIKYHELNCLFLDKDPLITTEYIKQKFLNHYIEVFRKSELFLLHIPVKSTLADLMSAIKIIKKRI